MSWNGHTVIDMDAHIRERADKFFKDYINPEYREPFNRLCEAIAPCAPGVATPSWGGLSAREGIEFLRGLDGLDIIAVDVNTVSPPHDVTAFLAAQVIYESLVLLCQKPS